MLEPVGDQHSERGEFVEVQRCSAHEVSILMETVWAVG